MTESLDGIEAKAKEWRRCPGLGAAVSARAADNFADGLISAVAALREARERADRAEHEVRRLRLIATTAREALHGRDAAWKLLDEASCFLYDWTYDPDRAEFTTDDTKRWLRAVDALEREASDG